MTSSWFFLSTLNYDARSTTHQISNSNLLLVSFFKKTAFYQARRLPCIRRERYVSDECRDLAGVCRIIGFKGGSDVTDFTVVTAAL